MSTKKPIKSPAKPITAKPKPKAKPNAQKPLAPRAPTQRTVKPAPNPLPTPTKPARKRLVAAPAQAPIPSPALLRPGSKQAQLLSLLQTDGATIPQMMELTGWQAHTLRATLSAVFRKRLKLTVQASAIDGSPARMFRIASKSA